MTMVGCLILRCRRWKNVSANRLAESPYRPLVCKERIRQPSNEVPHPLVPYPLVPYPPVPYPLVHIYPCHFRSCHIRSCISARAHLPVPYPLVPHPLVPYPLVPYPLVEVPYLLVIPANAGIHFFPSRTPSWQPSPKTQMHDGACTTFLSRPPPLFPPPRPYCSH